MDEENYSKDAHCLSLAKSLAGLLIVEATVVEEGSSAVVRLRLGDTHGNISIVDIGVTGNLHDEAYLIFDKNT